MTAGLLVLVALLLTTNGLLLAAITAPGRRLRQGEAVAAMSRLHSQELERLNRALIRPTGEVVTVVGAPRVDTDEQEIAVGPVHEGPGVVDVPAYWWDHNVALRLAVPPLEWALAAKSGDAVSLRVLSVKHGALPANFER